MANNSNAIQLNRVSKGFGDLNKALTQNAKSFASAEKQSKSFTKSMGVLDVHVHKLSGWLKGGIGALLTGGAWKSGLQTMGELQELSMDAARSMGELNKQGEIMGEVFKGASELGISYGQMAGAMKSAAKFHAQLQMTNKDFMEATKNAAAFGEATGMGAERGAEMMGELVGYAKVTPKELRAVQDEFVHLQKAIGFTGEELSELAKGVTPLINQIKNLGATADDVQKLVKATGNMAAGFAAMGKSAGQATQFMDRLLDPERFNENIVLFNKLGVSADKALSAMMGEDTGGFLDDIQERLPEISKQIVSMGPMAGAQMAKQLGLQWRDVLDFQKMGTAEAKKRAQELDKERKDEQAFQKELQQTLKSWQRTFVSISHMFDGIRMKLAGVLGGQNFAKMEGMIANFANKILDSLGKIDIAKYLGKGLDMIETTVNMLLKILPPVADIAGKIIEKLSKMFEWSEKIFGAKGPLLMGLGLLGAAKIGKALPGLAGSALTGGKEGIMKHLGLARGDSRMRPLYVQDVGLGSKTGGLMNMMPGLGGLKAASGLLSKVGGILGKAGPWAAVAMAAFGGIRGAFFDDENLKKAFGKSNTEVLKASERFAGGIVGALDTLAFGMLPDDMKERMMKHINERGIAKTLLDFGPIGLTQRFMEGVFDEQKIKKILGKNQKEAVTFADRVGAGIANSMNIFGIMDDETVRKIAKAGAGTVNGLQRIGNAATKGAGEGALGGVGGMAVGGNVAALAESFKMLLESTDAYQKAIKDGLPQQRAYQEALFKGGFIFGASLNDLGDAIDTAIMEIKDFWASLKRTFTEVYNSFKNAIIDFGKFLTDLPNKMLAAIGTLFDEIKTAFVEGFKATWDKVVAFFRDGWSDFIKNIRDMFLGWINSATASMSDGMNRLIYRIIRGMEGIPVLGEAMKGASKGFAESANAAMQQRFAREMADLEDRRRKATTQGDVDVVNKMIDDLSERADKESQFLRQDSQAAKDGFKELLGLNRQHLPNIAKHTETSAGAGLQVAANTQKIADNTRKPKKFIDINSLAIRANESRNVFFSYSTGNGQA